MPTPFPRLPLWLRVFGAVLSLLPFAFWLLQWPAAQGNPLGEGLWLLVLGMNFWQPLVAFAWGAGQRWTPALHAACTLLAGPLWLVNDPHLLWPFVLLPSLPLLAWVVWRAELAPTKPLAH